MTLRIHTAQRQKSHSSSFNPGLAATHSFKISLRVTFVTLQPPLVSF